MAPTGIRMGANNKVSKAKAVGQSAPVEEVMFWKCC